MISRLGLRTVVPKISRGLQGPKRHKRMVGAFTDEEIKRLEKHEGRQGFLARSPATGDLIVTLGGAHIPSFGL